MVNCIEIIELCFDVKSVIDILVREIVGENVREIWKDLKSRNLLVIIEIDWRKSKIYMF